MKPEKTLSYVKNSINYISPKYEHINEQILKSALIYQCLYFNEFKKILSIDDNLLEQDGEIGLIGPGDGFCTGILERLFGKIKFCYLHSGLHDSYGRFYTKYNKGRGYCYAMPRSFNWMKKSPLLGHISGFLWSIKHSSKY